mmetsp:Transcript_14852/g.34396  ORF Transcript_14852/g.34396 Transcript_14852/m.34396 type:complete len:99 (+) Transcript_14852:1383-1679(+)
MQQVAFFRVESARPSILLVRTYARGTRRTTGRHHTPMQNQSVFARWYGTSTTSNSKARAMTKAKEWNGRKKQAKCSTAIDCSRSLNPWLKRSRYFYCH